MDEICKEIHIEFRGREMGVGFQGSVHGKGYIRSAVVIEREDGSEYYPWGNILAVRARNPARRGSGDWRERIEA